MERLFDAFNRRDQAAMAALCDPQLEFHPVTAAELGRATPYVGAAGLAEYLEDVGRLWDELLILPVRIESRGRWLLVHGRVYLRGHEEGIRDLPAGWVWELAGQRFRRGEVFADPQQATDRFDAAADA